MESPKKLRIAIDAMGGDYAPEREIAGAAEALRTSNNAFEIVLVGNKDIIEQKIKTNKIDNQLLSIIHASQVITMDDSPMEALKRKKDSSLAIGMNLHKEKKVDAIVSAGNTGAVLSAASLILGRIEGVSRPTIGASIPADKGFTFLVDAGANVDCRAQQLYEFAVMASTYVRLSKRIERPKVALLNVGEEKTKGNSAVLEAYELLSKSKLNFIGNVEGRDILKYKADVVVCDGFVGNIILKFGESMPLFLKSRLKKFADKNFLNKLAVGLSLWPLKSSLADLDPNLEGGVPILGVKGTVIIGHGSSSVEGIKNMIMRAFEIAKIQLNEKIEAELSN